MTVQRRRRQAISAIDKQRIVDAFEDPERDYLEMAKTLRIPRGTAWSIVRRYQLASGEVIVRRRGGGRHIKIDQEMQQCLVRLVEQHPNFTLYQLNVEMRHELPDKSVACASTVHRLLKGQLITLKKMNNIPTERNRDDVISLHSSLPHICMHGSLTCFFQSRHWLLIANCIMLSNITQCCLVLSA